MSTEIEDAGLRAMMERLETVRPEVRPSKYWIELNRRSLTQLRDEGYENFKRTLARSYFTWLISPRDAQFRFLLRHLGAPRFLRCGLRSLFAGRQELFSWKQSLSYNLLTHLLWEYLVSQAPADLLDRLSEPLEGNPPRVYRGGRLVTQDLANSVLEYLSIREGVDVAALGTVLELGSGYGRNGYVFQALHPGCRYIFVDIPPALYVCERYTRAVFPDRRVFGYRPFDDFASVAEEFAQADTAFLMADQLELLPAGSVDLAINISSLHEMRRDQIAYFLRELGRVTRGHFFFKQWKVSEIPFDDIVIREEDYPLPAHWERVYSRECRVQREFFEALYRAGPAAPGGPALASAATG